MKKISPQFPACYTSRPTLFLLLVLMSIQLAKANDPGKRMFILTGSDKSVQIPFVSVDNLIVVAARLNGDIPVNLILDTGSPTNLLTDPRISRKLNQNKAKEVYFSGPGVGQKKMLGNIMTGLTLDLGPVRGQDLAMVATSTKPEFLKRLTKLPVHGVLGYPFFHQFVVTIDYANNILTISEPSHFSPALDALALPFSLANAKPVLHTSLTIGKHTLPGRLLIDTGAFHEVLFNDDLGAKAKNLLPKRPKESLGIGFGGYIYGTKSLLPHFQLGSLEFRNVQALLPDQGQYAKTEALDQDGSIGNGLLKDFVVTIDYIRETLYLQKAGAIQQVAYQTGKEIKKRPSPDRQEKEPAIP
jgi:hypothetical protein